MAAIPAASTQTSTRRPGSGSARWARPKGKNADDATASANASMAAPTTVGASAAVIARARCRCVMPSGVRLTGVLSGGRHRPRHEQSGEHGSRDADRGGKGEHGGGHEAERVDERSARLLARVLAGGVVPRDLQRRGPDCGHLRGTGCVPDVDGEQREPLADLASVGAQEARRERGEEREWVVAGQIGRVTADPDDLDRRRSGRGTSPAPPRWARAAPTPRAARATRSRSAARHRRRRRGSFATVSPSTTSCAESGSASRPRTMRATSTSRPHRPSTFAVMTM